MTSRSTPRMCARRLSPRTKAVACVHFAGFPAPADRLAELCAERGLALIEDAAHAPGATLHGRKLGTWGRAGAFSLFANKILSVGEGGVLVTDDEGVAELARSLRSHAMSSGTWERHSGIAEGYDVLATGFNYRIDEPRSALAHSRLEQLDSRHRLAPAPHAAPIASGCEGTAALSVPYSDEAVGESSCNMMAAAAARRRAPRQLRRALHERHGIQTSVHFPPVHRFSAYRERFPERGPSPDRGRLRPRAHDPAVRAHERRPARSCDRRPVAGGPRLARAPAPGALTAGRRRAAAGRPPARTPPAPARSPRGFRCRASSCPSAIPSPARRPRAACRIRSGKSSGSPGSMCSITCGEKQYTPMLAS